MAITHYRVTARTPGNVTVELSFDGEGYCYGLDEEGKRLWRETDVWSVNLPEGADEAEVIHEHIAQWEAESHLPSPQDLGTKKVAISASDKDAALERLASRTE